MNWKHGGKVADGEVTYTFSPLATRYMAGTCTFHVDEHESWTGVDGRVLNGIGITIWWLRQKTAMA